MGPFSMRRLYLNKHSSVNEDHLEGLLESLIGDETIDEGIEDDANSFLLLPVYYQMPSMTSVRLADYFCYNEDHSKNVADEEVKRKLSEYIKNKRFDRAVKKTEMQFWLHIEEILSRYRNAGGRNLSSIWSEFQCGFGESPRNHFKSFPGSRLPFTSAKKDNQRSITGNTFSHMDINELHWSNRNELRDTEFQHDSTYDRDHHIRKEIVRCVSSSVLSTVVFLGISYNIWNSQLSIIHVPSLHKEHGGRLSIWPPLLTFFGFMVFVCAVAAMILVRAPFTSMQKAMLIFWAILLHLQSANSIIEVFVTLVGGLIIGRYAFGKKQPPNEVI